MCPQTRCVYLNTSVALRALDLAVAGSGWPGLGFAALRSWLEGLAVDRDSFLFVGSWVREIKL